jgi:hypothetical protein
LFNIRFVNRKRKAVFASVGKRIAYRIAETGPGSIGYFGNQTKLPIGGYPLQWGFLDKMDTPELTVCYLS